jgi:putative peptide zinc metalloprotease protein
MNVTRVLNNALPEIPVRAFSDRPPRVPPDVVAQEHMDDGKRIVRVVVPGQDALYRFPAQNWALILLFDGTRSFEQIAKDYSNQTGFEYSVEEIRQFAADLEAMEFWYRTPQEKNVQLMQMSAEERRKLVKNRKSRYGDLSEIAFPAINPDKFLTWLYSYTSWVYTWWFTTITIVAFSFSLGITFVHWGEIGRDTIEFFSFTHKTWWDVVVFYLLTLFTICWHELSHGHACKHYGGRVRSMGFLLIYLTPAFFTDTSEGFVRGNRFQRFIIAMAGAWSELYIWAVVTPLWWASAPGSAFHSFCYQMMLMSGLFGIFLNWNPLMKLDGYFMLSEVLGVVDLKENSTAFVSAWVKRHIWRLPVDVPYVAKKRRLGYAVYALLSGAYSYTVLFIAVRFVGNIFRNFDPNWSFIPEFGMALLIFRSRIRNLVKFMKFVYLDKKDRIRAWLKSVPGLVLSAAAFLLLVLPIWRESADARFILEPAQIAIVRNVVAGRVEQVVAREGMTVAAGAPLIRLSDLPLQSRVANSESNLAIASMRANSASLHYANLGTALHEREQMQRQHSELTQQADLLQINSPIAGTVLTPSPEDRLGSYLPEGTELLEVADLHTLRARAYVPDQFMYKVRLGAAAKAHIEGLPALQDARVDRIQSLASAIDPRLAEEQKLAGLQFANYYVVDLTIDNLSGNLHPGMNGIVRIYSIRTSAIGYLFREALRFIGRKAW